MARIRASEEVPPGGAARRPEPWYSFAILVLRPLLTVFTRRSWTHTERLPADRWRRRRPEPHLAHRPADRGRTSWYDNGRRPRFLAKDSLFDVFFVGRVFRGAGQIPVYRESRDAGDAFRDAVAAVQHGECVVVYPEGTLTRDPDLWPMAGKTGAARIALATGCPVIPMAQWGPQDVLAPYAKRPHLSHAAADGGHARPAGRPVRPARHGRRRRRRCRAPPTASWTRSPSCSPSCGASPLRRPGWTPGTRSWPRPATRTWCTTSTGTHAGGPVRLCCPDPGRTRSAGRDPVGGDGQRLVGDRVRAWCSPTPGNEVVLWGKDAEAWPRRSTSSHENAGYHPGIGLPDGLRATTDAAEALAGADLVVLAVPAQMLRANLAGWRELLPRRRGAGQPDEGHRAGHDAAHERGHRRGRPGAGRAGSRWCPGRTWRARSPQRQPAATVVACTDADTARRLQQACLTPYFRPYTNTGRRGHRDRRGGQERHRARERHGGRAGLRRERAGVADHPRAGRDGPAGRGARRRPDDVRRAGRARRPRRHLHVAAVAQPHVRR